MHPGTDPVLVVCSGVPLCAWHSTGVPVWQPAADIRDRRSSMSPLCWHHDTTSAVDSLSYPQRPRLSGGCSACLEQSATRDSGLLLTFDIPEGNQVSPFSSVVRLTWRRLLRWSADVCIELCNSFISRFCKVRPQLCDGSTLIHDICSSSSVEQSEPDAQHVSSTGELVGGGSCSSHDHSSPWEVWCASQYNWTQQSANQRWDTDAQPISNEPETHSQSATSDRRTANQWWDTDETHSQSMTSDRRTANQRQVTDAQPISDERQTHSQSIMSNRRTANHWLTLTPPPPKWS